MINHPSALIDGTFWHCGDVMMSVVRRVAELMEATVTMAAMKAQRALKAQHVFCSGAS